MALAPGHLWPLALIFGGLIAMAAATGAWLLALVLLAVTLGVSAARIWSAAGRRALHDAYSSYAAARGYSYSRRAMLVATTPLLAAGERRRARHYMEGGLGGEEGLTVGIAQYVVETNEVKRDRRARPISVLRPHPFTIAVVELISPAETFPGIFLVRRGGLRKQLDWLSGQGLVPATLDHGTLAQHCDLMLQPGTDHERLRILMRGDLQQRLAASPLAPGFEYVGGVLLVYTTRVLEHGEQLDSLIALTREVAERLQASAEPLRAVPDDRSKAPPRGSSAFPSPPPATKPPAEPVLRAVSEAPPPAPAERRSTPPPAG